MEKRDNFTKMLSAEAITDAAATLSEAMTTVCMGSPYGDQKDRLEAAEAAFCILRSVLAVAARDTGDVRENLEGLGVLKYEQA